MARLGKSGVKDQKYGDAAVDFTWHVADGRMGYTGTVRDDGPYVTRRPSTTMRQWAKENREALSRSLNKD